MKIEAPPGIEPEEEIAELIKEIEEKGEVIHKWEVRNTTEMEEFHPEQPIPHIVQLTTGGVL